MSIESIVNNLATLDAINIDQVKALLEAIKEHTLLVDQKIADFEERITAIEEVVFAEEEP